VYPELRVDLLKVALDCTHVEPQTLRDLLVGEAVRSQLRHALFLGGEAFGLLPMPAPPSSACQLAMSVVRQPLGTDVLGQA